MSPIRSASSDISFPNSWGSFKGWPAPLFRTVFNSFWAVSLGSFFKSSHTLNQPCHLPTTKSAVNALRPICVRTFWMNRKVSEAFSSVPFSIESSLCITTLSLWLKIPYTIFLFKIFFCKFIDIENFFQILQFFIKVTALMLRKCYHRVM